VGSADGLRFLQPNLFLTYINQRSETLTLDFGLFMILGFSFTVSLVGLGLVAISEGRRIRRSPSPQDRGVLKALPWLRGARPPQRGKGGGLVARATTTSSHAGPARAFVHFYLVFEPQRCQEQRYWRVTPCVLI